MNGEYGNEQALIEKVMTLSSGMNNRSASICVDTYCILPHVQLSDQFLGHMIGLKARDETSCEWATLALEDLFKYFEAGEDI